ncbi:MAG TPA: 6-bladed beta-propeller [Candidatus Nanoarchaeia archaeon]|nr:6-bladed beta-propeller [Candidatus Nanoarchaeia archaeon]
MSGDKLKRAINLYGSILLSLAMLGCSGKKSTIPEVKNEKTVTIGVNGGSVELDGMKLDFRKNCFSEDTEVIIRKVNPNINAEYKDAKSLEIKLENAAKDTIFVSSNNDGIGIYERDGTKHITGSRIGISPRNQVTGLEDLTTASIINGKKNEYKIIFDRYDGNSKKPIVVFIHGLNSNSRTFDFLREGIPNDYDIVSVEYDFEESTEISVEKIKSFLATLSTDREIYEIDHSKGCEVGLDLALNDKRIKKIIQLGPPNRGFLTKDESLNKSLEALVNSEMLENLLNLGAFGVVIPTKLINQGTKDMVVNSPYMKHLNQAYDMGNINLLILGGEYNSGNLDSILERPHDGLLSWITSNFNLFPSSVLHPRFSSISSILQHSSHGSIVREQQTLDKILEFLEKETLDIITPEYVLQWGSNGNANGQFKKPFGIEVDDLGNVYVTDSETNRIQKFTSDGRFISKFSLSSQYLSKMPVGIEADNNNNIYVIDKIGDHVNKFDNDGNQVGGWGSHGLAEGYFFDPWGIAVNENDEVYVADALNNRIQKFTSDGRFITQWGAKGPFNVGGSGDGELRFPSGIAFDNVGNVYVTDHNSRVQVFDNNGKFLRKFASPGSGDGQLFRPLGIAMDGNGKIYVADTENNRIEIFNNDGSFITKFGSYGSDNGQFANPADIALDRDGNIYVLDTNNSRVQKFGYKQ